MEPGDIAEVVLTGPRAFSTMPLIAELVISMTGIRYDVGSALVTRYSSGVYASQVQLKPSAATRTSWRQPGLRDAPLLFALGDNDGGVET